MTFLTGFNVQHTATDINVMHSLFSIQNTISLQSNYFESISLMIQNFIDFFHIFLISTLDKK